MMAGTQPTALSTPALYLSNWTDLMGSWQSRQLTQLLGTQATGLRELHYFGGPRTSARASQIVDHAGFFRDETDGHSYTLAANFDTEAWFEDSSAAAGVMTVRYLTYRTAAVQPRCKISRSYAAVPNQPFFVVRYSLSNPTAASIEFNLLDQVHVNNLQPPTSIHGFYDAARNALFADMRASGQFVVVLGAFAAADGHQAGDDANATVASADVGAWHSFDQRGQLPGNNDVQAADVDLAFNQRVTLAAGASQDVYFYITVRPDVATAQAAADTARARPGADWFAQTATTYTSWLANAGQGRRIATGDAGLDALFEKELVAIKNLQNPAVGTFAASTNPSSYGHKNWVRDGSITAIALDASGHFAEAELYWRWMASAQTSDGSWKTTYDVWDGTYLSFVEPEYDSVGQFIYGVYRHYEATGDSTFANDLWPAVQAAANWILANISQSNGLGAADFSIWEEPERGLEHNVFTQAWYVAGLYAAQWLSEMRGDTKLADWYAGGPGSILTALQRRSDAAPPGLWNPDGYYNRAVNPDDTVQPLQDSSSDILFPLGIVDPASGRANAHIGTMLGLLSKDGYGIARYEDDRYYFDSPFDPAGNEAGTPSPPWPQLGMWVAIYKMLTGDTADALARLQWFTSTTGAGYMPQGEALNTLTRQSVLSSMSEPLTASSFILAALVYERQYDLRIAPPIHEAGAYRQIAITPGTAGDPAQHGAVRDLSQWDQVPYYVANAGLPPTPGLTIRRVYICNDAGTLYLRVDSASGSLPTFDTEPKFALRIYSEDLAHLSTTTARWGLDLAPLHRPASFAVEQRSDENQFRHWSVVAGAWTNDSSVAVGLPPQWDPACGSIEAAVPISALSSGPVSEGTAWGAIAVTLATHDPVTNTWKDGAKTLLHYRLTTPNQPWIYGNVDE
jgi:GH15 family glucan-1,4-alpha-glucosidase